MLVTKNTNELMREAVDTVAYYFNMLREKWPEMSDDQIIELCKVAGHDFNAAALSKQLGELIETIEGVSRAVAEPFNQKMADRVHRLR